VIKTVPDDYLEQCEFLEAVIINLDAAVDLQKDMRKEQGKKLQRKIIPKGKKSLRRSPKLVTGCLKIRRKPCMRPFSSFGLLV